MTPVTFISWVKQSREALSAPQSNPVIVAAAVKDDPERWLPEIERLVTNHPMDTEDELAWKLIAIIGKEAAALLYPVYEESSGEKGYLSMQVNPKFYPDADRMTEQAKGLASLAPNIAIKAPATAVGMQTVEDLTAAGIRLNVTVCFTVAQAVKAAEAIERGVERARAAGVETGSIHPYVTVMVGRLDDQLRRVRGRDGLDIDEELLTWAGVATFKRAVKIFRERGYCSTLLAAAYRYERHWSEIIGPGVLQTLPYSWWKQFDSSETEVSLTLDTPVDEEIVSALEESFEDFRKAYHEDALTPEEYVRYGPTVHTLNQFIGGYNDLLAVVRGIMLGG